ncbi:MAG: hypothetical protein ACE5O2_10595, partial [Armatimonadota bacterium]
MMRRIFRRAPAPSSGFCVLARNVSVFWGSVAAKKGTEPFSTKRAHVQHSGSRREKGSVPFSAL